MAEIIFKPKWKLSATAMHIVRYAKCSQLSKRNIEIEVKLLCDITESWICLWSEIKINQIINFSWTMNKIEFTVN